MSTIMNSQQLIGFQTSSLIHLKYAWFTNHSWLCNHQHCFCYFVCRCHYLMKVFNSSWIPISFEQTSCSISFLFFCFLGASQLHRDESEQFCWDASHNWFFLRCIKKHHLESYSAYQNKNIWLMRNQKKHWSQNCAQINHADEKEIS